MRKIEKRGDVKNVVLAHNATACERASQHDVMGITENEENELRAAGRGV